MKHLSRILFLILASVSLSSCLEDENKKADKITEWETKCLQMRADIAQMQQDSAQYDISPEWRDKLVQYKEQRANEDATISNNENTLRILREERDLLKQRLEEYKITHPIE